MMTELFDFLRRVLRGALALLLWLFAAALAVALLLVALMLLLAGSVWALLRGRRPTRPVFVGRFQEFTRARVWPGPGGGPQGSSAGARTEVLDVEVREVHDVRDGTDQTPRH